MIMNDSILLQADTLLIICAIASSFLLGCVHRLCRTLGEQRREAAYVSADVRELTERCDQQHVLVKRIQDDFDHMRERRERVRHSSAKVSTTRANTQDPCKLARAGAGVETLMSRCRLSRAEAELVYSVHGASARAA